MAETKWTKGPWRTTRTGKDVVGKVGDCDGMLIAKVNDWMTGGANASLIAAAPELYEALTLLCDVNPSELHIDEVCRRHDVARAALAKARGENG